MEVDFVERVTLQGYRRREESGILICITSVSPVKHVLLRTTRFFGVDKDGCLIVIAFEFLHN